MPDEALFPATSRRVGTMPTTHRRTGLAPAVSRRQTGLSALQPYAGVTIQSGGSTWTFDTANHRVQGSGGSNGGVQRKDGYVDATGEWTLHFTITIGGSPIPADSKVLEILPAP